MSINSILKKEGIQIIRKLDTLEVNRIAKNISDKISKHFSEYLLSSQDLFSEIARLDMYLVHMSSGSSSAKYLYKNNSIYFNENVDLSNSIFALHECLHFLQAQIDENGNLTKLGLCTGTSGNAINEAAVQLMASTAQESDVDSEKYYGININTISPDCYPLECALVTEMLYFTGTYPLYHSTLNSNDVFKNTFISYSNKKTYDTIEKNLDKILQLEDDLYYFSVELSNVTKEKDVKLLNKIILNRKNNIKKIFFETQNLIIQNCFSKLFDNISTLDDVKNFQTKLYNFKNVLCYTDDYQYYNEYYCNAIVALDSIRNAIVTTGNIEEYKEQNQSLALIDNSLNIINIFKKIVQKIRNLFYINQKQNGIDENLHIH